MLSAQKYGENLPVNYSPFGTALYGRNWSSEESRFGFNGMEKDDEVKGEGNSVNYTFRMYDSRIGRPNVVDPLTNKFPELSPYQFFSNNPIWFLDLEGLEGVQYDAVLKLDGTEVITRRIIEIDIHVAVSKKTKTHHYKESDIPKLEKGYKKEFSGNFEIDGNPVLFVINVKTFDIDQLENEGKSEVDYLKQLAKNQDNYIEWNLVAGVLVRRPFADKKIGGATSLGLTQMNVDDNSHNRAHELGHMFLRSTGKEKFVMEKSFNIHNQFGGIFSYDPILDLNQQNVTDFGEALPKSTTIEVNIETIEQKKGL